jgi:DNA-binding transcriptional regulator YdaS (Cro superfamily)
MPRIKRETVAVSSGLQKIRQTLGLQSKLARHLGVTRQAISDWPVVPINRLAEVEQFTGIDRAKLRPDIFERPRRKRSRRAASHASV